MIVEYRIQILFCDTYVLESVQAVIFLNFDVILFVKAVLLFCQAVTDSILVMPVVSLDANSILAGSD